jgi:zinc protease
MNDIKSLAPLAKAGALIHEHALDNGLTVILAERHTDPVVAVMLWYRVGSRNEREAEAGVSHFLEHMMFKGSAQFGKGEVDRWTTQLGGSNNAFTSFDHTGYWFELASDRWEKALEIEADRMKSLQLDPLEFNAERAVVLEELSMGDDDPWRTLSETVAALLIERHPYRRPIIGHADALERLSVDAMRDYYKRFYHPGNATLVLAGDIEPANALALVHKHFGSIPRGVPYAEADTFRPAPVPSQGERRVQVGWDDRGKRVCMAWPGAPVGHADDATLDVISTVLTGGRLSRLYRRLVHEEGLATSISTSNDARVESGIFWLFAECAQGTEPAALEAAIDEELARLADEPVPSREIKRVIAMLEASEAYDQETASDLAEEIGEYAVDARWQLAFEGIERIKAVTWRDVRDCARRLFKRELRVVGWSLPKDGVALAKPPPKRTAKKRRTHGKREALVRKIRKVSRTGRGAAR